MNFFSKYGIFYSYTEEQTSMTMPSEMQPVSYQQEGEYDMTESAPRHDRGSQSTLTTVSELILVSTVDESMPVSIPTPQSRAVKRSDDAPNRPLSTYCVATENPTGEASLGVRRDTERGSLEQEKAKGTHNVTAQRCVPG